MKGWNPSLNQLSAESLRKSERGQIVYTVIGLSHLITERLEVLERIDSVHRFSQ